MPNRLTHETSPYLLQHADNPVDWYPWTDEALDRAKRDGRPILLSIGYSACHWCHVMAHESFEDAQTADLMNERFVNIKVDREERPDLDSIYMNAVQQMTGRGGWPMTVFLTPDGIPFYGGTYYPPEPRHGMPSFQQVLRRVSDAYQQRRDEVESSASQLHQALRDSAALRPPPAPLETTLLDQAADGLRARFDENHGGFGSAPKFPQPMIIEFLLRQWHRTGNPEPLRMAEKTLRAMANGGMYDQVGGGFHRYSVDAHWLVPHFEKMLYDNALLARVYLHAYQATGEAFYRRISEQTLEYAKREMLSDTGGFYSAQDADSEGVEGKFYVWSREEIDEVLGDDAEIFRRYYNISAAGSFEGANIPHVTSDLEMVAAETGSKVTDLRARMEAARGRLYSRRAERVWPGTDEKVITAWNAMMLRAFAEAGRVLDSHAYREIAIDTARFLLTELRSDGRLMRTYRDGVARIPAFLEDHAMLIDALVATYEATFNLDWIRAACSLADEMLSRFWDEDEGVFYDTAVDAGQLVIRPRDIYDNATPSGNSAAIHALLRLGPLTGEPRYSRVASRSLEALGGVAAQIPSAFGELLCALDRHLATPREIAIIGHQEDEDARALLDVLRSKFLPNILLAARGPDAASAAELIPLLAQREAIGGKATAYVCHHFICKQPVTEPADLERALEG